MDWFDACLLLFTIFSVSIQIFVLWLVLNQSPSPMLPYRFFLIANSLSDLFFASVLGFLLQPDLLFPAPALIVQGLAKYFGPHGGIISFALAVFGAACQVHFQNWSLLYRWSVVQKRFDHLSESLTSLPMLIFIALHGQLIAAAFAFGSCSIFEDPSIVPHRLFAVYNLSFEADAHVFLLANLSPGLSQSQPVLPIIGIGLFLCMLFWFFLSVSIIRLFRAHSHVFSARTYQLHMQLNILLILQLLSPILLIILPIALGLLGLIAHAEYGKSAGQMGVLLFALYALNNPLMTIFFVSPYRRFTLAKFGCGQRPNNKIQPAKGQAAKMAGGGSWEGAQRTQQGISVLE